MRQELEAAPLDVLGRGEERGTEIEDRRGLCRHQAHAMLTGDIGEPPGDIGAAGKDDRLNLCPDRGERGAGFRAAIQEGREFGRGH
ncbi:MAG: hypothetical protein ACREFN_17575, partial [Acetobacteraceae bacterium]